MAVKNVATLVPSPHLTSCPGVGGYSDDGQLAALVNPSLSIALSPLGGFQFFLVVPQTQFVGCSF